MSRPSLSELFFFVCFKHFISRRRRVTPGFISGSLANQPPPDLGIVGNSQVICRFGISREKARRKTAGKSTDLRYPKFATIVTGTKEYRKYNFVAAVAARNETLML